MDRINDGARVLERNALALAEGTSTPSSVDQPGISFVLTHLFSQHGGVFGWMPNQKGLAKASREGSNGFLDTVLSSRNLGSVAGDEVVHDLAFRQLGHRRQHSKSITREQDNVLGVTTDARDLCIRDVLDRVGATSVFGQLGAHVVDDAGPFLVHNVFKDGSETDRVEDFRFLFCNTSTGRDGIEEMHWERTFGNKISGIRTMFQEE